MTSYSAFRSVIPRTDPRLGRHVNHDSRSRGFAFRAPVAQSYVSVIHERHIPILDQGDLGSCTGNAAVGHIGTGQFYAPVVEAKVPFTGDEKQALALYGLATQLDGYSGTYPPNDTGSDGLSVAKAAQKAGLISGYLHTFTWDDFMAAVQKQPVIVGTNWYEGMFDPDASGLISISGQIAGGHEYLIRGYDANRGVLLQDNSWGPSWGVAGSSYFPVAVMKRLLSEDGDATMFVPLSSPAPAPVDPPAPQPGVIPAEDQGLLSAGNVWEKTVLSRISKAGKMRTAFDAWKSAKGY